jgi:two-component system nitrogen regulation response regulator GlnG
MKLIQSYTWPGNVRQLENMVKRLGLTAKEANISVGEVEQALSNQPEVSAVLSNGNSNRLASDVDKHLSRYFDLHGSQLPPNGVYQRILKEVELPLITIALDATGGNQAKCAILLGINRNTLRKKISELDIQVTRRRKLM